MPSLTSIDSTSASRLPRAGIHVAIISDGNGRWATAKGLPRSAGHRAGAETARSVIAAAPGLGIHALTLFALSSANWQRPASEVAAILRLLHEYLLTETSRCVDEGVRLNVIGRRDRLPVNLRQTISDAEAATAGGGGCNCGWLSITRREKRSTWRRADFTRLRNCPARRSGE